MKYWNNPKVKAFRDIDGVVFIKGPFVISGRSYDWKFIDRDGVDYAMSQQLEWWDIELKQVIDNENYLNTIIEKGKIT
jgi:hypothetical protein